MCDAVGPLWHIVAGIVFLLREKNGFLERNLLRVRSWAFTALFNVITYIIPTDNREYLDTYVIGIYYVYYNIIM